MPKAPMEDHEMMIKRSNFLTKRKDKVPHYGGGDVPRC